MIVLSEEQVSLVVTWMNDWEQLLNTAIPIRFKEDMTRRRKEMEMLQYPLTEAQAIPSELVEILKEISEAKGRYNMDRMRHAANTIEDMQGLAKKALKLLGVNEQ